jgi:hypothetical protein
MGSGGMMKLSGLVYRKMRPHRRTSMTSDQGRTFLKKILPI